MKQVARVLALATASSTWIGASPTGQETPSPLHSMHGSGFHRGHSMRAMLVMSASVVKPAEVQTVPLYEGLGNPNFTVTTASPQAQRYFSQGLAFAYGFNHAA